MPAVIDRETCTGCGICVFDCGVDALTLDASEKAKLVRPCVDCFICEAVCPVDAIRIVIRPSRVS